MQISKLPVQKCTLPPLLQGQARSQHQKVQILHPAARPSATTIWPGPGQLWEVQRSRLPVQQHAPERPLWHSIRICPKSQGLMLPILVYLVWPWYSTRFQSNSKMIILQAKNLFKESRLLDILSHECTGTVFLVDQHELLAKPKESHN